MGKSILKNIKQLLLIVFSVVLGIFLSERIEDKKNEKEAALLLSKIESEVADNKQLIEQWLPYHQQIVQRLDSLVNDPVFLTRFIADESVLFSEVLTEGSLMGRFPASDAWDIAKAHPLFVYTDYEDVLLLSKLYSQQEMAYASVPQMVERLLSPDFNLKANAPSSLYTFRNQMREIVGREIQYRDFLRAAEKRFELDQR